jgi:hypothetical protein
VVEGVEAVLVLPGVDDLAVELRRGVEVVVVVVEAGLLQRNRLFRAEHAEGGAGLHAQLAHRADHLGHGGDVLVLGRAPGRAHAEARRAGRLGRGGAGAHLVHREQLVRLEAGVEARRLRAVGAVLGATAGLDREQGRDLHLGRVEMLAVRGLRAEQQLRQGQVEQRLHLGAAPVVTQGDGHDYP